MIGFIIRNYYPRNSYNQIIMVGTHIIIDLHGVSDSTFELVHKNNFASFNDFVINVIKNNGATPLNSVVHHFNNVGSFTVLYLLAESHLSLHTWPEKNYIAMDVFTCGDSNTTNIANELKKFFKPEFVCEKIYVRGENEIDIMETTKINIENKPIVNKFSLLNFTIGLLFLLYVYKLICVFNF